MSNSHGRLCEIRWSRSSPPSVLEGRAIFVSFLVQYQLHLLSTPYLGFLVGIHRDQLQYDRFKLFEISQKRLYVKYILFFIHIDYLLACKLHKSIGICSVQRFYYIFLYSSSFCTSLLDSYRHIRRLKWKIPMYCCRTFPFGANYFYSHKFVLC